MLRLTFWILLVANIVMFGATQTYTDSPKKQEGPHQPQPIEPEKIRLLPSVLIKPQPLTARATEPAETAVCYEIGEFDTAGTKLFLARVHGIMPDGSIEQRHSQNTSSYMVYLPPAKNRKAAEKRITTLQEKGVSNYFLITNGAQFKNAISLGIFKNEEAAKKLIAEMVTLGFDDVTTHARASQSKLVSFIIRNPDRNQMQQLEVILADFPQVSKKECEQQNNFAKNN